MPQKEELIRKIQAHRRFLDDLLMDIAGLQEAAPASAQQPETGQAIQAQQERLMKAREVQEFLGIKPATFYDWLKKGTIPPGENFGGYTRTKRWRMSVISASLAGHDIPYRKGHAK